MDIPFHKWNLVHNMMAFGNVNEVSIFGHLRRKSWFVCIHGCVIGKEGNLFKRKRIIYVHET